jgi:hypothetical protein
MLYVESDAPGKATLEIVSHALKYWAFDNNNGSGMAYYSGQDLKVNKGIYGPKKMLKRNPEVHDAVKLVAHVRKATDGSVCAKNSHPFVSCDGKSAFMHNGIIFGWQKLREKLVAKGHKFTSDTDSEVMLHLGEEVGPSKLMDALSKEGVSGMANWIWMMPRKTVAFSDGSLFLIRKEFGFQVALFSDVSWAETDFFKKTTHLNAGTLVVIKTKKRLLSVTTTSTGTIGAGAYYRQARPTPSLNRDELPPWWQASTSEENSVFRDGGWERRTKPSCECPCNHNTPCALCRQGTHWGPTIKYHRGPPTMKPEDELEQKLSAMHEREEKEKEAWISPGDLFCKSCNVVSSVSGSGYCPSCGQTLIDVADML